MSKNLKPKMWGGARARVAEYHKSNGLPQPILYLPMWERSGETVYDLSGGAHHGAFTNETFWTGDAIEGDGSNDYIDCGGHSDFVMADSFTLHCIALRHSATGTDRMAGTGDWSFGTNDTKLRFTTHRVKDYDTVTSGLYSADKQFIASVVLDAADDASFYVDGSFVETVSHTNGPYTDENEFAVCRPGNRSQEYWYGLIYLVSVYNKILSFSQIKLLHEEPYGPVRPRMLFWDMAVAAKSAAPGGGVSIPIARSYYSELV